MGYHLALGVLFLSVFNSGLVCCSYQHIISVDAHHGHDSPSCLQPGGGVPCQTLEFVQSQLKSVSSGSVKIEICQPGVNLTKPLNFTDMIDFSIAGEDSSSYVRILCNKSGAGLVFMNGTGLSLSYLRLFSCGAELNTSDTDFTRVAAMHIIDCWNISITNTVVKLSNGTGISILDTNGTVIIENTTITESTMKLKHNNTLYGSKGLNVQFNPCHLTTEYVEPRQTPSFRTASYTIRNLTTTKNNDNDIYNRNLPCKTFISGGGAWIWLGPNTANVSLSIYNSNFSDNHAWTCGGGLLIFISDTSHNNNISVVRSVIAKNTVGRKRFGGGLQIIYSFCSRKKPIPDKFEISKIEVVSCNVHNNSALSGGGVNIYSDQVPTSDDERAIHFINCSWTGNTAWQIGSAVHLMAGMLVSGVRGRYPATVFTYCNFTSNMVVPPENPGSNLSTQVNGVGTLFSSILSVVFQGEINFENNNGTALYLSGSIASFSAGSQVMFKNNSGRNGGAVYLVGQSYIYLNGSSNFTLINNTASDCGGAVYYFKTISIDFQPCFLFRPTHTEKSTFIFDSNQASGGQADDIFASSLNGCELYCNSSEESVFDCIGLFTFSDPHNNTIATLPTNFSLNSVKPVKLFPGLSSQLPLVVTDSVGNKVPNVSYQATLINNGTAIGINPQFQYVSANTINVVGQPEQNGTLHLDALTTSTSLLIDVVLQKCPPGYVLDNITDTCVCNASKYYGLLTCDPHVHIRYGVWMGECNNTYPCTADCPIGFCFCNTSEGSKSLYYELPMEVDQLEGAVCSNTRTGTVCGKCIANHSVYYNSWIYYCGREDHCHLGPVYFVLSTLTPMTVLFLVIILVDENFASDWNSFLLFAQIVYNLQLYGEGTIHFSHTPFRILGWIMYIYGIFNLEFFQTNETAFCIWRGANVMDIMMFKLGSICFALGLVLFAVCVLNQRRVSRHFPCLLRRRYSIVNSISAFFILCYTQCLNSCFKVLVTTCLYDEHSSCFKHVVLYSGDMEAFRGEHLKYGLVALVFLLFLIIIPPLLLFFYPLFFKLLGLCRLSESRLAITLWRAMPIQLLDSFQNPFKDNYRFFAGLYFLYRLSVLTVHANVHKLIQSYVGVGLLLLVCILFHSTCQPFKSRLRNVVDMLLFFNLALLNASVQYMYMIVSRGVTRTSTNAVVVGQMILLLLPLVCAAVYLTSKLLLKLKNLKPRFGLEDYSSLGVSHNRQTD